MEAMVKTLGKLHGFISIGLVSRDPNLVVEVEMLSGF